MTPSSSVRPFLKWAGGKRALLSQIAPHIPKRFGRYHEPFVGGGALFFHLGPRRAFLSDTNTRLVRTYRALQQAPERVIRWLRKYPHDREFFEQLRAAPVDRWKDDVRVAAWLIYLNRTCFNGLYRVNRDNRFNVPFGDYADPTICDEETLRACSRALACAELHHGDFADVLGRARKGDLVYFDPPYVPLSATSSFTSYTRDGFTFDDQARLCDVARTLKACGVHVLITNADHPAVRQLYRRDDFRITKLVSRRNINARADRRGRIMELLIR